MEANGGFSIKIKANNSLSHTLAQILSGSLADLPKYLNYTFSYSFSIGHHNDYYLLNSIKTYFNFEVKIRNKDKTYYFLETYKKEDLNKIISHCKLYPLLGDKSKSLDKIKVLYL